MEKAGGPSRRGGLDGLIGTSRAVIGGPSALGKSSQR